MGGFSCVRISKSQRWLSSARGALILLESQIRFSKMRNWSEGFSTEKSEVENKYHLSSHYSVSSNNYGITEWGGGGTFYQLGPRISRDVLVSIFNSGFICGFSNSKRLLLSNYPTSEEYSIIPQFYSWMKFRKWPDKLVANNTAYPPAPFNAFVSAWIWNFRSIWSLTSWV